MSEKNEGACCSIVEMYSVGLTYSKFIAPVIHVASEKMYFSHFVAAAIFFSAQPNMASNMAKHPQSGNFRPCAIATRNEY